MISLNPDEVEHRFAALGIPNRFTSQEKANLSTTPIVTAPDGILAFPTPSNSNGLNILNLRMLCGTDPSHQPSFFDHPWYLEESFAAEDCTPGWHVLHMEVIPESISQPFNYARSLGDNNQVPTAIEIVLMLFLHYVGTKVQLLHKKHSWCRDRASMNRQVTVGAFGRNGLFVSGHPAEFASRGLGICAKLTR